MCPFHGLKMITSLYRKFLGKDSGMPSVITFDEFDCKCTRSILWTKRIKILFWKKYPRFLLSFSIVFMTHLIKELLSKNPESSVDTNEALGEFHKCLIKLKSCTEGVANGLVQIEEQGHRLPFSKILHKETLNAISLINEHLEAINISRNKESFEAINSLVSQLESGRFTGNWKDDLAKL